MSNAISWTQIKFVKLYDIVKSLLDNTFEGSDSKDTEEAVFKILMDLTDSLDSTRISN
jgi:hypothetical protein